MPDWKHSSPNKDARDLLAAVAETLVRIEAALNLQGELLEQIRDAQEGGGDEV